MHTSAVLSMLYNANRDPKHSRPRAPRDFHPYLAGGSASHSGIPITKATMSLVKQVLCK
jgi:hypothetical protein